MTAYYNEIDANAAAWLRELIRRGLIADGEVDQRSIEDVTPNDLRGFDQCHFFAGIGVWSYALRCAGWPDDRPVWTGSCPCQPFSAAGKGGGFDDERHLWPSWFWLIAECRPAIVFGEQVASKDAEPWIDLVQDDMEALGYGVGAVPFPAAGIGAPHIRDRLYWVADAVRNGTQPAAGDRHSAQETANGLDGRAARSGAAAGHSRASGGLADDDDARLPFGSVADDGRGTVRHEGASSASGELSRRLADTDGRHSSAERQQRSEEQRQQPQDGIAGGLADASEPRHAEARQHERGQPQLSARLAEHGGVGGPAGPTNGLWRDADWLLCRDGKWRPVEPGTFPLAHGAPARMGCVCAACLEASAQGANNEDLRALRKVTVSADRRLSPEILQPTVPMGSAGPDANNERGRTLAGATPVSEHSLRVVRSDRREPSSSPGREPQEQRSDEHPDTVPSLPQQSASCERCGATDELYEVTITGNSRVARLRGYGNGLVAPAAQAFIESYIEASADVQRLRLTSVFD